MPGHHTSEASVGAAISFQKSLCSAFRPHHALSFTGAHGSYWGTDSSEPSAAGTAEALHASRDRIEKGRQRSDAIVDKGHEVNAVQDAPRTRVVCEFGVPPDRASVQVAQVHHSVVAIRIIRVHPEHFPSTRDFFGHSLRYFHIPAPAPLPKKHRPAGVWRLQIPS